MSAGKAPSVRPYLRNQKGPVRINPNMLKRMRVIFTLQGRPTLMDANDITGQNNRYRALASIAGALDGGTNSLSQITYDPEITQSETIIPAFIPTQEILRSGRGTDRVIEIQDADVLLLAAAGEFEYSLAPREEIAGRREASIPAFFGRMLTPTSLIRYQEGRGIAFDLSQSFSERLITALLYMEYEPRTVPHIAMRSSEPPSVNIFQDMGRAIGFALDPTNLELIDTLGSAFNDNDQLGQYGYVEQFISILTESTTRFGFLRRADIQPLVEAIGNKWGKFSIGYQARPDRQKLGWVEVFARRLIHPDEFKSQDELAEVRGTV